MNEPTTDPMNGWEAEEAFFGDPWPSDVCEVGRQTETPVGVPCFLCEEVTLYGQQGLWIGADSKAFNKRVHQPVHRECLLRQMVGSVEHLEGKCPCNGWPKRDDQTFRQEALATWTYLEERHWQVPEARRYGRLDA